jgi:hypothetical protein
MFFVRPRRYYKNGSFEVWSMEHNYGDGFFAEDKLIIQFNEDSTNVWLVVKDKARKDLEEYMSYVYGLIDYILSIQEDVNVKVLADENVQEYYPEDLLKKLAY